MSRYLFLLFVFSHYSYSQDYFSDAFHLAENTSEVADVVLAVQDTVVVATADLCNLTDEEDSCVRFIKLVDGDGTLEIVENKVYNFGTNHGKARANYFIRSQNGGYVYGANLNHSWTVLKLNDSLDTLWRASHNSSGSLAILGLVELSNGDILLSGFRNDLPNVAKSVAVLLNPNGEWIWTRDFSEELSDSFHTVAEGLNGNYVLGGYTNYFVAPDDYGESNGYIVKTNAEGDFLDSRIIEGLADDGSDDPENTLPEVSFWERDGAIQIYAHHEGGYIFHQNLANYFASDPSVYIGRVMRLDEDLNTLWEYRFDQGERWDEIRNLQVLPDGSIIGCGKTENGPHWGSSGWIFKLSSDGELLWKRIIIHPLPHDPNSKLMYFNDLVALSNGDIVAVGTVSALPEDYLHYWIVKVDSEGCLTPGCNEEVIYAGIEDDLNHISTQELFFISSVDQQSRGINLRFYQPFSRKNGILRVTALNGQVLHQSEIAIGSQQVGIPLNTTYSGIVLVNLFGDSLNLQQSKLVLVP